MNRKYLPIISITVLLAMMVLTSGCGVKINGKEYEMFSVGEKEKSGVMSAIGSEASEEFTTSVNVEDAEKLMLSVNAGNIDFQNSDNSKIKIEADKKVRGASENDKDTILENMNIVLERDGKNLKIVVKTKDKNDFWEWLKDNYNVFQVTINYKISLPKGISAIDVNTGAGNIEVQNLSAELSINTGAGIIDVDEVTALGSNKLNTGTGNIDFSGNVDDIKSFEASTGAGTIDFNVPEDSRMSLEAHTGIGLLSGSFIKKNDNNKFSFEGDINGGGPRVKLNSGVGNVSVDKD